MRFNDLLRTVLAADVAHATAAVTVWRQCIDLLAQNDQDRSIGLTVDEVDAVLDRLDQLRARVDVQQRMAAIVELGPRLRSPTLLHFFSADTPAIAAAAASRAMLSDDAWPRIIARLGPIGRNALRNRRELGPLATRALDGFGANDLLLHDESASLASLPGSAADQSGPTIATSAPAAIAVPQSDDDQSQIRRIVDRIEQFTVNRQPPSRARTTAEDDGEPAPAPDHMAAVVTAMRSRTFRFQTDAHGVIVAADGVPRSAVIGLNIAEPTDKANQGPDGHVIGAFRRRGAFRNARFAVAAGVLAGDWLMTGVPRFDTGSGRFTGYDGIARRPSRIDAAPRIHSIEPQAAPSASAVSMQQLVHELRTPLNAIIGFADIISGQLFGPAAEAYRDMASQISTDAAQLLNAFEDLDLASRMPQPAAGTDDAASVDAGEIADRVIRRYREDSSDERCGRLDFARPDQLPDVAADPKHAERLVQHFVRTMLSVTQADEVLTMRCIDGGLTVDIDISRPCVLRDKSEGSLLDPDYALDGDWPDAPLLGLGFSFRLIQGLAQHANGRFLMLPDRFRVSLPAIIDRDRGAGSGR